MPDNTPIIMTEEYWASSPLSVVRYTGSIRIHGIEYIIVNKEGKDIYECSHECRRAGREKAIEPGEPYFVNQCAANEQSVNMIKWEVGWNNKMFTAAYYMPHQIEIMDVRIERLQGISTTDCLLEGVSSQGERYYVPSMYDKKNNIITYKTPREAYAALIDKVSGKGTWESNPFVFVYTFKLIK